MLLGVAMTVIVASGGTTLGQVVRIAGVLVLTGYAVLANRVATPLQRAALALGIGAIGAATGYAIGISHTAAEGLTPRALAGLVALIDGVSLLVTGTIFLLRILPTSRSRLLVLAVIPLSLVFVLLPLATAVRVANPPSTQLNAMTPGDRGYPYDDVTLVAGDGVKLSGWYVPSQNRAAVALVHDSGASRSSVLSRAVALARSGYGVLVFDTRGNGTSDGDAMDLGWPGERDVEAAVDFLSDRYDVDPLKIGLVGVGRGGEGVLLASAVDGRIRAAVVEGLGRRTPADSLTLPVSPVSVVQGVTESLGFLAAGALRQSLPPRSLRGAVGGTATMPLLIIAEEDSRDSGRLYRAGEPDNVQLWELPNVPHGQAYALRAAQWEEHVSDFFQRGLTPRPVRQ